MKLNIYVDGACYHNGQADGQASWAFYVPNVIERAGEVEQKINILSTNNRGELTAILEALKWCKESGEKEVRLLSDSTYSVNTCRGVWNRNTNMDLLNEIDSLSEGMEVDFVWVKGHDGNENNEIANSLAQDILIKKLGDKYSPSYAEENPIIRSYPKKHFNPYKKPYNSGRKKFKF